MGLPLAGDTQSAALGLRTARCCVPFALDAACEAAAVQNHLYRGESSAAPRRGSIAGCAAYEGGADAVAEPGLDAERYPWAPGVRCTARASARLYGTAWAQDMIYRHQHPANCTRTRFLALRQRPSGIGSNLHVLGQALALAMNLGRVLVLADPDPRFLWHNRSFCRGAVSWECWFLPMSGCRAQGDVRVVDWPALGNFRVTDACWRNVRQSSRLCGSTGGAPSRWPT